MATPAWLRDHRAVLHLGPAVRISASLALVAAVALGGPASAGSQAVTVPQAPDCPVFPQTNVWNLPVDTMAVREDSNELMASIGLDSYLHPDFSSTGAGSYGIPYNVVGAAAKKKRVQFKWPNESDPGPYPIPRRPRIEGGSDRHLLIVDRDACYLYELSRRARRPRDGEPGQARSGT
jgi:hypothetical protein